jgi:hypothetical protein
MIVSMTALSLLCRNAILMRPFLRLPTLSAWADVTRNHKRDVYCSSFPPQRVVLKKAAQSALAGNSHREPTKPTVRS